METKFTKGKWKKYRPTDNHKVTHIVDFKKNSICEMNHYCSEVSDANALLISKAPEMFEMLLGMLTETDDLIHSEIKKDIQQLLKEATEL